MPPPNPKNYGLNAAQDLGIGDSLQQSLTDAEEERRKKLLQQSMQFKTPANYGDMALNPGTMQLYGRGGAA